MSEFDEFEDDILSRRLKGAAGGEPDHTAARARVHERLRVARRRRTVLATGGSAVLLAGLIGTLVLRGGSERRLVPAVPPPTPTISTDVRQTTTSPPDTTTVNSTEPSVTSTLAPATTVASTAPASTPPPITVTTLPAPLPVVTESAPDSTTPTPTSTGPPSTGTDPASTTSTTTTTAPTGPATQTFLYRGNSIVVTLENDALSLVSTSAAPGYTMEPLEVRPDRVRVAFVDATGSEARIEVNLIDGQMVPKYDTSGSG